MTQNSYQSNFFPKEMTKDVHRDFARGKKKKSKHLYFKNCNSSLVKD